MEIKMKNRLLANTIYRNIVTGIPKNDRKIDIT